MRSREVHGDQDCDETSGRISSVAWAANKEWPEILILDNKIHSTITEQHPRQTNMLARTHGDYKYQQRYAFSTRGIERDGANVEILIPLNGIHQLGEFRTAVGGVCHVHDGLCRDNSDVCDAVPAELIQERQPLCELAVGNMTANSCCRLSYDV
jgi:hypothetical protein